MRHVVGIARIGLCIGCAFTACSAQEPPQASAPVAEARSGSRAAAYVADVESSRLVVLDVETGAVQATIDLGNVPLSVALTTDGSEALVTSGGAGTLSVVDTAAGSVTATIPLGFLPFVIAVHPGGHTAYVTSSSGTRIGTVSVIDTAAKQVKSTIRVPAGAVNIALSPQGDRAYVSSWLWSHAVSVIDTATDTVVSRIDLGPVQVTGVGVSAAAPYTVYAAVSNDAAASTRGALLAIDPATASVVKTIPLEGKPGFIARHADLLYIASHIIDAIEVVDPVAGAVRTKIPVGEFPVEVAFTPDGRLALATCNGTQQPGHRADGYVAVIDTATNAVVRRMLTSSRPTGIAIGRWTGRPDT